MTTEHHNHFDTSPDNDALNQGHETISAEVAGVQFFPTMEDLESIPIDNRKEMRKNYDKVKKCGCGSKGLKGGVKTVNAFNKMMGSYITGVGKAQENISKSMNLDSLDLEIATAGFSGKDTAFLKKCGRFFKDVGKLGRALMYTEARYLSELLGTEPGGSRMSIKDVSWETDTQKKIVQNVLKKLNSIGNLNSGEMNQFGQPNFGMMAEVQRRNKYKENPKYKAAKSAVLMLLGTLFGAWGVGATIAGLRKGEPVNPASAAAFTGMYALWGGFKNKPGPAKDLVQPRTNALLAKGKLLKNPQGTQALKDLTGIAYKEKKALEKLALSKPGAKPTPKDLSEAGITGTSANILSKYNYKELASLHQLGHKWRTTGNLDRATSMMNYGVGPQSLKDLPSTPPVYESHLYTPPSYPPDYGPV